MQNKLSSLVNLISNNHPELITYYELSNRNNALDVSKLVKAYDLDERYKTSLRTAIFATYLSLKRMTKKEETLKRLEEEYQRVLKDFYAKI